MTTRRDFLKTAGVATAALLTGRSLKADETTEKTEFVGVLFDAMHCIGCRKCEWACRDANGLPNEPIESFDDKSVFEYHRKTNPSELTVVNRYAVEGRTKPIYVKEQCLHCNRAACAAACLTVAMKKTRKGPVIWQEGKCMGCRFCMVSCPFDVPKFEYDSPNPKISKCTLCWERLQRGERPACVGICPTEALVFGSRRELIREARRRFHEKPGSYVDYIYGESEAGGTGWLYVSPVPFERLGFNTRIESRPYDELTKGFLYGVPLIFILWPAMMLGIHRATKSEEPSRDEEGASE